MITDPCEVDYGKFDWGFAFWHKGSICEEMKTGKRTAYKGKKAACYWCGESIHPNGIIALKFKRFKDDY